MGVPGYAHPLLAAAEWTALTRPGTPLDWVVLTVANGPGDRPDPDCLAAAGRLVNAGVRVLGQLDLAHGARPVGELAADAERYALWYRVGGFLLDRCPSDRAGLAAVRRTTAVLRAVAGTVGCVTGTRIGTGSGTSTGTGAGIGSGDTGGTAAGGPARSGVGRSGVARSGAVRLVLGHGTQPYPGYAEIADQLVTFCGSWADYRWSQVAEWTADHPPGRFAHFVHGVPRTHLEEAVRIARWQGAGTVFFTDRRADRPAGPPSGTGPDTGTGLGSGPVPLSADGPVADQAGGTEYAPAIGHSRAFESLPGYWDDFVSQIGPGVSE
ncbi:spherulation-specific family 4 protein [Streptomyces sp. NPDC020875]|uniref:spherulation-specific family 4 protein n=1 Tax=Streptomyces sp. NPDC020875 TaxID=3154898 RepID=UPI0033C29F7F